MVRFITFEMVHGKRDIGSTRLRAHQLIKYWPDSGLYKYGENPDTLVFQKVYVTEDYTFPAHFPGLKILDICDPDWLGPGILIKETVDAMDGVTVPTEALAELIRQLTDKPVRVVPDRHDLEAIPPLKVHEGELKHAVWFGYKHNAKCLQFAIPSLEARSINLTVISEDDPSVWRWANNPEGYQAKCSFKKFDSATINRDLQDYDIAILPAGVGPRDRFKSNNKTSLCWLVGLPVVTNSEELEAMKDPGDRNVMARLNKARAWNRYDVRRSVKEMRAFIKELKVKV